MKSTQAKSGQGTSQQAQSNSKTYKGNSETTSTQAKSTAKKNKAASTATVTPGKTNYSNLSSGQMMLSGPTKQLNSLSSTAKQSKQGSSNQKSGPSEMLEVTVIPVDQQPYSQHVQIPLVGASGYLSVTQLSALAANTASYGQAMRAQTGTSALQTQLNQQYPSLKDLFQNSDSLWKPIFGSFVGANKKPQFAIFRKPIERRGDIPGIKRETELSLHILYLKRDITQFPRNAFANQIEVYCSKFFYGPLVVVFCDTKPPYKLHDFPPQYLIDEIEPLNELEQKCYPLPFGAKRCSLVRALMNEDRFTHNLENLERVLSNHEFMLYCYKTSFCPISNSTIHDWSKCNYAHRQQDFRRPPYLFFYYPERCPNIGDDGSWEACKYELQCDYSHTLVEILFNPLHYKLADCSEKTITDKFKCVKHKERCCHAHSEEEKSLCNQVLEQLVPKVLPQKEDLMQYYLEILPDYQIVPGSGGQSNHDTTEDHITTQQSSSAINTSSKGSSNLPFMTNNNGSGGIPDMLMGSSVGKCGDDQSDSSSNGGGMLGKKPPVDATKAAANLQEASDLQRQRFMDVFQQMQQSNNISPVDPSEKAYRVKSDTKSSSLLRPENPFNRTPALMKPLIVMDSSEDSSPLLDPQKRPEADFRPFDPPLEEKKTSIFDKLDGASAGTQQPTAVDLASTATQKVDKRLQKKKGGKLVKGIAYAVVQPKTMEEQTEEMIVKSSSDYLATSVAGAAEQRQRLQSAENNGLLSPTQLPMTSKQTVAPNSFSSASSKAVATESGGSTSLQGVKGSGSQVYQPKASSAGGVGGPTTKLSSALQGKAAAMATTTMISTSAPAEMLEETKQPKQSSSFAITKTASGQGPLSRREKSKAKRTQALATQSKESAVSTQSMSHHQIIQQQQQQQHTLQSPANTKEEQRLRKKKLKATTTTSTTTSTKGGGVGGQQQVVSQVLVKATAAPSAATASASDHSISAAQQQHNEDNDNGECADYELPKNDKESQEADIKMVKLQLLQHQIKSLQLSQEDQDNFYLYQIGELKETIGDSLSIVPLLSSRESSPAMSPRSRRKEEEQIIAAEETKDPNNSRPTKSARLKQKRGPSQSSTTSAEPSSLGAKAKQKVAAVADRTHPQQQQPLRNVVGTGKKPLGKAALPIRRRELLPEELIFRQMAKEYYSTVDAPDYFEADSMSIIALSFGSLRRRRKPIPARTGGRTSLRQQTKAETQHHLDGSRDSIASVSGLGQQHVQQHAAGTMFGKTTTTLMASTSLASQHQHSAATYRPSQLEGHQLLQVTHNRLLGFVGGAAQHSWLYAFNWALFSDPLLVWNACEVNEEEAVGNQCQRRGWGHADQQWQVTFNSGGVVAAASTVLSAFDTVPSLTRQIWGLPLATSEGFGDSSLVVPLPPTQAFPITSPHHQQQEQPPTTRISPTATDSSTKHESAGHTYKKGNKNGKNGTQASLKSSNDLNDQNKA